MVNGLHVAPAGQPSWLNGPALVAVALPVEPRATRGQSMRAMQSNRMVHPSRFRMKNEQQTGARQCPDVSRGVGTDQRALCGLLWVGLLAALVAVIPGLGSGHAVITVRLRSDPRQASHRGAGLAVGAGRGADVTRHPLC